VCCPHEQNEELSSKFPVGGKVGFTRLENEEKLHQDFIQLVTSMLRNLSPTQYYIRFSRL
jgi:hypothetical protein